MIDVLKRLKRDARGIPIPRILQIELTSHCNATCFFCAHTYSERPQQNMDPALFKKIIDEARGLDIEWLYLTGLGEPMLHPKWRELYQYCKGLPGAFTTNCSTLKEDDIDFIFNLNFIEFAFSLDTLNPARHLKLRGFSVDRVYPKIDYIFKKARNRSNNPRLIVSTTITYDTLQDMPEMYDWLVPKIDGIPNATWHIKQIGPFPDIKAPAAMMPSMEFIKQLNTLLPKHPQVTVIQEETSLRPHCTLWFDRITILSDGSIVPCCHQAHDHNHIGNAATSTIQELFNSQNWVQSQIDFAHKNYDAIPYCRDCR